MIQQRKHKNAYWISQHLSLILILSCTCHGFFLLLLLGNHHRQPHLERSILLQQQKQQPQLQFQRHDRINTITTGTTVDLTHRSFQSHHLFVSSSPQQQGEHGSFASSPHSSSPSYQVIYQKVIRWSQQMTKDSSLFLPILVEYIQSYYNPPNHVLTMPYEKFVISSHDTSSLSSSAIIYLDSPLSSNTDSTRLDVEVMAIYPQPNSEEKSSSIQVLPTMAMVVIKKKKIAKTNSIPSSSPHPPMMVKNLFQDSEQKIVHSLDQGLNDFMNGNIRVSLSVQTKKETVHTDPYSSWSWKDSEAINRQEDTVIQSKVLDDMSLSTRVESKILNNDTSNSNSDHLMETAKVMTQGKNQDIDYAVAAAAAVAASLREKREKALQVNQQEDIVSTTQVPVVKKKRSKTPTSVHTNPDRTSSLDAEIDQNLVLDTQKEKKMNHASKKKTIASENEPESKTPSLPRKRNGVIQNDTENHVRNDDTSTKGSIENVNRLNPVVKTKKSFRVSISTPQKYTSISNTNQSSQESRKISSKATTKQQHPKAPLAMTTKSVDVINRSVHLNVVEEKEASFPTEEDRLKSFQNLPLRSLQEESSSSTLAQNNVLNAKSTKIDEGAKEKMKAALDILSSFTDTTQENGFTPEELLDNVLKFGEESKKQELEGTGFVDGVFQKTKELVAAERQKQMKFNEKKENNMLKKDYKYHESNEGQKTPILSTEEELKKIFAAGERIVEARIVSKAKSSSDRVNNTISLGSTITDDYLSDLISSDESVRRSARTLDVQLAELEVQVARTPGEKSYDANGPNPVFDVFSGPEVYNPNVDPAIAVNWPGAVAGTRTDIRLHPDLANAIQQSTFAADALVKLREVASEKDDGKNRYFLGEREVTDDQVLKLRQIVNESVAIGLISDPLKYLEERSYLQLILSELRRQPQERFEEIASNYKDLLLSDSFPALVREHLRGLAQREDENRKIGGSTLEIEARHSLERASLSLLVNYAQLLLKEVQALGAELEVTQLEVVRSICLVAMDPSHTTEEETTTALADAVRDMRPLLDENFVAYLKYAIAEEEARLARSGMLDDPDHNRWLFVLKIVQEGVYAELAKGIQRYIDHLWYVLRMESKAERRSLLSKLIDAMPSLDVRPFVKVVDNIAASLGSAARGEFDTAIIGPMTNKLLQLRRDVHELLPPERIKLMSREADEWVARQRQKLMERRNTSLQRLQAAKDTADYTDESIGMRGEVERMT